MQILNLKKGFENLKMDKNEPKKDCGNKVMKVVNQIWLLGEKLPY